MKEFLHDDYDYQEKHHFKWDTKGKACEGMEDICYKCPNCGEEFHMVGNGDDIHCDKCGFSYHSNEYLELVPSKQIGHDFKYPSKWVLWERKCVIDEIRKDPNYSFSFEPLLEPSQRTTMSKTRLAQPRWLVKGLSLSTTKECIMWGRKTGRISAWIYPMRFISVSSKRLILGCSPSTSMASILNSRPRSVSWARRTSFAKRCIASTSTPGNASQATNTSTNK